MYNSPNMLNKVERHELIRQIVSVRRVRSHEELQALLKERGANVTQATLSRDLNELGVLKVKEIGTGYTYRLPETNGSHDHLKGSSYTGQGIESIEFNGNGMAVIKTIPGFAGALAAVIDTNNTPHIMGTLAGDDTVLLILRDGSNSVTVLPELAKFIDRIEDKRI